MSCSNAIHLLFETGLSRLAGDGLRRVEVRFCAAAMAQFVKEATGITSVVGYHNRVSAIRSAAISDA